MLANRRLAGLVLVLFGVVGVLVGAVAAAEQGEKKAPDVSGTWKWTVQGRDGQSREIVLKLKQEGQTLTGTLLGFGNTEVPISDGKISDDGQISFKVVRKREDREFTTNYTAKLEGDVLKGKSEMTTADGQTRTREFEATRVKEPA
ncbi:hypothetical protein [Fontivita pretiosa]|uniref:hypothetical protein n=1 Tax=Fontivita pretiosa TaxID=2989684 RepID=UPI003D17FCDA